MSNSFNKEEKSDQINSFLKLKYIKNELENELIYFLNIFWFLQIFQGITHLIIIICYI